MAWQYGKHEVLQPAFTYIGCKFSGMENLILASVVTDQSGNKRAIKMAKLSGILSRGLSCTGCPKKIDNVWLAWSFQTNFMFRPKL